MEMLKKFYLYQEEKKSPMKYFGINVARNILFNVI